jgi:predicted nucleic acid-binding protein
MIAIINASPLIYLGKIGALSLLPKLFSSCFTTNIVKYEVLNQKDAPEYIVLIESFSD